MKVAFLHLYLATESGDPRMVLSIAKECKRQGNTVKVYTSEFNPNFLENLHRDLEIVVVPPPKPLSSVLGASGFFGKIFKRIQKNRLHAAAASKIEEILDPDFDFVFAENDATYMAAANYRKKHPVSKAVWIMNNPPFYHSRKSNFFTNIAGGTLAYFESLRMKRFSNWIDWVIVYDKKYKEGAEKLGFKAKLMGNPLDFEYFYSPVKVVTPQKPIRLLAAGALSPQRGFEDVVDATVMLKKRDYHPKTTIVCKDYWADKEYRKSFENYIKNSGADDCLDVRFNGVEEAEMMRLLKESHISVAPNRAHVWIVTSCEAMAAGMPALISKDTAMVDIFDDRKNVLFFEPYHPEQIASLVMELVDDPELFSSIATNGQLFIKENLSFPEFWKEAIRSA